MTGSTFPTCMHRAQSALGGGFSLLTLILSLILARPDAAEVERSGSSFYGKFGVGLADYMGDFPIQTWAHPLDLQEVSRGSGLPLATVGELGYRFSSAFGLVLGFPGGNYPISGYAGGSGVTDSDRVYDATSRSLHVRAFRSTGSTVS